MTIYFKDIPNFNNWNIINPINRGWSKDKKYYIETFDKNQYLLKISDISQYETKKKEFENLKLLTNKNILMSCPVDFGICNNTQSAYSLFTWINGNDAEDIIPTLNNNEQYMLGVKAGIFLKKIHSIPAPSSQLNWSQRFNEKINRNISRYKNCSFHFPHDDKLIKYIEQNRHLLSNRPQCFQHGDYHVGNMIITPLKELGIIDFNRFDYGDPFEEFNRITWSASISPLFASGYINGYFKNKIDPLFFKLMALYVASNQLSSIPWAIPFGDKEVLTMINQAKTVLSWYDNFKNYIPNWYLYPNP